MNTGSAETMPMLRKVLVTVPREDVAWIETQAAEGFRTFNQEVQRLFILGLRAEQSVVARRTRRPAPTIDKGDSDGA